MKITLNHNSEEFPENQLTVSELLERKNFTFKMLVIKVNGTLVRKNAYDSFKIHTNDNVIILHLMSGG